MQNIKVGDIVARRSYGQDVFFKVIDINENSVTLKGITYRIIADAPISDLVIQPDLAVEAYDKRCFRTDGNNREVIIAGSGVKYRSKPELKKAFWRDTTKGNMGNFPGLEIY